VAKRLTRGNEVKRKSSKFLLLLLAAFTISGCITQPEKAKSGILTGQQTMAVPESYLRTEISPDSKSGDGDEAGMSDVASSSSLVGNRNRDLAPISWKPKGVTLSRSPVEDLSTKNKLSVSAEKMPLRDFVHYVFGDLLGVNYVLGASVEAAGDSPGERVTLSVTNAVSSRELFELAAQLLDGRGVKLKVANETYFVYRENEVGVAPQVVIGIGADKSAVPKTNQRIMQVIPVKFGIRVTLERTLRTLGTAKITPDFSQSTIFAEGSREEVLRVIELIDLLDTPATRGRYIGLVELTFTKPTSFANEVLPLLENEGIDAAVGRPQNKNLVLVPLKQLGAVAVFATDEFLVNRVRYWSAILDVPSQGDEKQYYIYNPKFSRAVDLDDSISGLLGIAQGGTSQVAGSSTGNAPSAARVSGFGVDGIQMVVDEKANAIVFYSTGLQYRTILPLLRKLDVMPKQVMLDIMIAEVSLKDEFKHGVEWAIERGEVNVTTQGAFGATAIGGIGLVLDGAEGPLQANFLTTNSLVNVLSNPSVMVRDGTSANINVGSNISVVGQTTQDPINGDRQTTSSEYRKTGVDVTVKVTINAAGIVVMEIQQSISNSVPGSAGAGGNPDIFERSIKTEILAQSGQTVMLGGLISETASSGESGTPLLSKVPLLGGLFKAASTSSDRTELIMLVTPKVIEDLSGWDAVLQDFGQALLFLESDYSQ
jgi:general secretion pathway protein D